MGRRTAAVAEVPAAMSDRLLDAAEVVFAREGFDAARLEDVAAAVGIRRPSLLHHFATKAALHEAVVRRAFDALGRTLMTAMTSDLAAPPAARLEAVIEAWLAFLRARPAFAPLLLREVMDGRGPGRELLARHVVPLIDGLEAWLEQSGLGERAPARAALLALASSSLVRAASGPLERPLWGARDETAGLARALIGVERSPREAPVARSASPRGGSAARRNAPIAAPARRAPSPRRRK